MSNPNPPETTVSPETRLIPLRLLRHDDTNVRGNASDPATTQADAELVASIKAHGLLDNLVVTPRAKTLFGVAAGARRLRALQVLAADKHIPKNHPVPCLVIDNDAAAESSLVENSVRIVMHPADQVRAFSRLAAEDATSQEIAARFGLAERTVQKRMRLGGLASEILDAYRAGQIKAETAEAFATTADVDFQRIVFEALKERGQLYGHNVRHALAQRQLRSDSPIARFVGLDAYREAGGALEDPLFDDDYITILDPDLMLTLATAQLEVEAAAYAKNWKWCETLREFTWSDKQRYYTAAPIALADFTPEETAALEESEARAETAHAELESCADPDRRRELTQALDREEAFSAATERARADRHEYSDVTRAHGGVIVTIDDEGILDIHHGLVRADDADAYQAANSTPSNAAATTGSAAAATGSATATTGSPATNGGVSPANGGYSDALRNDLRIMRTAAVRRALAHDIDVATDLIAFVLARMVGFGHREPRYETAVFSLRKEYQGLYASDAMKTSPIMEHLEPVPQDVDLSWIGDEDAGAAFRSYRALPDDERASVLAHAVATLTVPHLANDHDVSGAHEQAVTDLGIDLPSELAEVGAAPFDADIVWNRMNKGMILDVAAETIGSEWARNRAALKKTELVAAAAAAFRPDPAQDPARDAAATRWMPPGFEPTGVPSVSESAPTTAAPDPAPGQTGLIRQA